MTLDDYNAAPPSGEIQNGAKKQKISEPSPIPVNGRRKQTRQRACCCGVASTLPFGPNQKSLSSFPVPLTFPFPLKKTFYKRSFYIHKKKQLKTPLALACICREPVNPEELTIQCDGCDVWRHGKWSAHLVLCQHSHHRDLSISFFFPLFFFFGFFFLFFFVISTVWAWRRKRQIPWTCGCATNAAWPA
jgi:hypothetical protein